MLEAGDVVFRKRVTVRDVRDADRKGRVIVVLMDLAERGKDNLVRSGSPKIWRFSKSERVLNKLNGGGLSAELSELRRVCVVYVPGSFTGSMRRYVRDSLGLFRRSWTTRDGRVDGSRAAVFINALLKPLDAVASADRDEERARNSGKGPLTGKGGRI